MWHSTYGLGGREGGSAFGNPGPSSVMVGDREGRGGGGARSYLYTVLGTAFMFNSTGRRPVSECDEWGSVGHNHTVGCILLQQLNYLDRINSC